MAERIRTNAQGIVEGYDDETGEVLWVQAQKPTKSGKPRRVSGPGKGVATDTKETHHFVLDGNGRKIWVPKGTNPDHLPKTVWPYSQVTADQVLAKITEGYTVTQIGKMEGFPPQHTIYKWVRQVPEFRNQMKLARSDRAEFFHDKVIESAEKADPENVQAERLRVDAYKWAASVGDPDQYGTRVKHAGDVDAPLGFIVVTGVPEQPAIDVPSEMVSQSVHSEGETE